MGNRYSNPYDPYWYDYDPMYGGVGGYYDYNLSAWRPRSRGLFGSGYGYYYSPYASPYDYYYPAATQYPYFNNYYQPMMQPYYYPRTPYF
ncbi:predicted protein [Lichtheimia corymbifera JMRC:FSU:9682]|uniref:Uncharacterized protein n=1 Tax=Lichtheimia corymbifera JMRC:FSU:9682 TaxID=1263082 RepID=A0A068RL74_9FUNG|nr:predicted protein [Lichtheimia corymbifera JMRC:FSU:9682]